MNEIKVNNTSLTVKEYNGQRVVTLKDVDSVHGRPEGTARKRFNDNRKHFVEGEDFYKISPSEFRTAIGNMDSRQSNDVTLLTESGYLMLVKSFTDELAWSVQRQLVNSYFRVKQIQADYSALSPQLQFMIQMEQRQNELEKRQRYVEARQNVLEEQVIEGQQKSFERGYRAAQRINSEQQAKFREIVHLKAEVLCGSNDDVYKNIGKMVIADIYRAIHKKFNVNSYTDIRLVDFREAIAFVRDYKTQDKS